VATSLTQDEYRVLQHALSGKSTEEIAAILDLPVQVVLTCVRTLFTKVLNERELTTSPPAPPPVGMPALSSIGTERPMASPPFAHPRTLGAQEPAPDPHGEPAV
jgi:hypothetical protein